MRRYSTTYLIIAALLVIVVGIGAYIVFASPSISILPTEDEPRACTAEAKMCPDGSYVGRTGPNCEFAACPGENSVKRRECPEAWYEDRMPGPPPGAGDPPREYMVIAGARIELSEMDVPWVRGNCEVNKAEPVY